MTRNGIPESQVGFPGTSDTRKTEIALYTPISASERHPICWGNTRCTSGGHFESLAGILPEPPHHRLLLQQAFNEKTAERFGGQSRATKFSAADFPF